MPFTFSHPAIVLPFKHWRPKWFSATGLITGSVAPDFLYFIEMDGRADFGHTLAGIFFFDLPFSCLLAIVFHRWVRNPFLLHLPAPLDRKYAGHLDFRFPVYLRKHWPVFVLSVLLGAISHIGWDYFGSPRGQLFYLAPSFFNQYVFLLGTRLRLYLLIERIGSALGLAFLGIAAWQAGKPAGGAPPAPNESKWVYWLSLLTATLLFTGLKFWFDPDISRLGHVVLIITSAACYAVGFVTALYAWLAAPPAHG
ncbi:MAG: DUF4184 family protein [Cytophagales bacterium]|nr:DUF4184 family protein [Cytophagales bacterium]